jgi:hypothetical protein
VKAPSGSGLKYGFRATAGIRASWRSPLLCLGRLTFHRYLRDIGSQPRRKSRAAAAIESSDDAFS